MLLLYASTIKNDLNIRRGNKSARAMRNQSQSASTCVTRDPHEPRGTNHSPSAAELLGIRTRHAEPITFRQLLSY